MKPCPHEYGNDNCTNCANGLPSSAYECAKTRGELKEYCHNRAESIRQQRREETIDEIISMIEDIYYHDKYCSGAICMSEQCTDCLCNTVIIRLKKLKEEK